MLNVIVGNESNGFILPISETFLHRLRYCIQNTKHHQMILISRFRHDIFDEVDQAVQATPRINDILKWTNVITTGASKQKQG